MKVAMAWGIPTDLCVKFDTWSQAVAFGDAVGAEVALVSAARARIHALAGGSAMAQIHVVSGGTPPTCKSVVREDLYTRPCVTIIEVGDEWIDSVLSKEV